MKLSPLKSPLKYIVIHCSATQAKQDIGAKEITAWHRERGFLTIGYHFVIRRDGTVETGRGETEVGAHAEGFNSSSLSICLVGGIAKDGSPECNFTEVQYERLRHLVNRLHAKHPDAEVLGHRDLPGVKKACPTFDVREWYAQGGPISA